MSDRNKVEVKIRGRFFTITANEPEEYIYKICSYVDRKMDEILQMNSRLSTDMAALLTAINISDEYYKSHVAEDNLREQILMYDEEAGRYEKQIKELEAQVTQLKEQLSQKEEELTKFLEQF